MTDTAITLRAHLLTALADLDDGAGTLATVVDLAMHDSSACTVADVREIVLDAQADARVERQA